VIEKELISPEKMSEQRKWKNFKTDIPFSKA